MLLKEDQNQFTHNLKKLPIISYSPYSRTPIIKSIQSSINRLQHAREQQDSSITFLPKAIHQIQQESSFIYIQKETSDNEATVPVSKGKSQTIEVPDSLRFYQRENKHVKYSLYHVTKPNNTSQPPTPKKRSTSTQINNPDQLNLKHTSNLKVKPLRAQSRLKSLHLQNKQASQGKLDITLEATQDKPNSENLQNLQEIQIQHENPQEATLQEATLESTKLPPLKKPKELKPLKLNPKELNGNIQDTQQIIRNSLERNNKFKLLMVIFLQNNKEFRHDKEIEELKTLVRQLNKVQQPKLKKQKQVTFLLD